MCKAGFQPGLFQKGAVCQWHTNKAPTGAGAENAYPRTLSAKPHLEQLNFNLPGRNRQIEIRATPPQAVLQKQTQRFSPEGGAPNSFPTRSSIFFAPGHQLHTQPRVFPLYFMNKFKALPENDNAPSTFDSVFSFSLSLIEGAYHFRQQGNFTFSQVRRPALPAGRACAPPPARWCR